MVSFMDFILLENLLTYQTFSAGVNARIHGLES